MASMSALSPHYGLALIVLHGPGGNWPGLLLHSRQFMWPFDEQQQTLTDVAELAAAADRHGLYRVDDLFADHLPEARSMWAFHLPARDRKAVLAGPDGEIQIDREPNISDRWWASAVENGGACRLLVAACIALDPAAPSLDQVTAAVTDGRVYGATIPVRFFPEVSQ
jgi:hypothetical protein